MTPSLIEPCTVTAPECPSCDSETESRGDLGGWACYICGLYWPEPDEPGYRLGDHVTGGPCGKPDGRLPLPPVQLRGRPHRYTYAPCQLPAGHASDQHYHPGRWVEVPDA